MDGTLLGVDFGTSNTAAVLHRDGQAMPLLFDGSPLLPSAVYLDPGAGLLVGRDAERAAGAAPARFEPNPKRRIDDGTIWLDEQEVTVVDAIGAVLHRVGTEAIRVAGVVADQTVLTHPAGWGGPRMRVLAAAAGRAGLPAVRFVPEPVAAASYFTTVMGRQVPVGRCVVVYDFGGGTFDVAVVLHTDSGLEVLAADGLPGVGGLDLDATIVTHVRAGTTGASQEWGRLDWPQTAADRRARGLLWQDARAAKEQLSRHPSAALHIPLAEADCHITREEFERLAHPILNRTVEITIATLRTARVGREAVSDVFLVGGSSRVPLAASMLHRALGIPPTVIEQPELVVAAGAPHAARPAVGTAQVPLTAPPLPVVQPPPVPPPPPAPPPPTAVQPPQPTPALPPVPTAPASPVPVPASPVATPATGNWPPSGPVGPFAGPQPLPAPPPPPRPPGLAGRSAALWGAPLLRAAGWMALGVGVSGGLLRLAFLLVELDSTDFESWISEYAASVVNSVVSIVVAVLVWRLTRADGARAWNGAGLLLGYALLAVIGALVEITDIKDALDSLDHRSLVVYNSILFVVVAAITAAALPGLSRPPWHRRRPRPAWAAVLVAGAVVSAVVLLIAFAPSWSDFEGREDLPLISIVLLAVALPVYGIVGRPAALAVGLLASWFTIALPIATVLFTGWDNAPAQRVTFLGVFMIASVVVALAAVRCVATEAAADQL